MATKIVRGDAQNAARVSLFTPPSSYSAGQVFRAEINKKRAEYTVQSGDGDADVVAGLQTAFEDADATEFGEVDATEDGSQVTFTAATAGVPFHLKLEHLDTDGTTVLATSQKISFFLRNTPTGGTFTITFDGETTGTIAYNASAATVQTALEGLANVDSGDVTASGGALPDTAVVLEFAGNWADREIPLITIDEGGLTGGDATLTISEATKGVPSQNQKTKIRFKDTPSGGNFQLVIDGTQTADIAYNASNATVKSAIEALPAFQSGDITVTGSGLPGNPTTIEFGGSVATESFTVELIESDLTGFSYTASTSTSQNGSRSTPTPTELYGMEAIPDDDLLGSGNQLVTASGFSDPTVDTDQTVLGTNAFEFTGSELVSAGTLAMPYGGGAEQKVAFSVWVRPDDLGADRSILFAGETVDFSQTEGGLFLLQMDGTTGAVRVKVAAEQDSGDTPALHQFQPSDQPALEAGKWALVAVVLDNTTDGAAAIRLSVSLADQTDATPYSESPLSTSGTLTGNFELEIQPLYVGGTDQGGYTGLTAEWDGHMDELYKWLDVGSSSDADRIDDDSAVNALFNGGSGARPGAGQNEIQTVSISGTPTEGAFDLTVTTSSGTETAAVDYDEDAAGLESALEALANVGSGNVTVSGSALPGGTLTVEFINALGETDLDEMTVDNFDLRVEVSETQAANAGTNEVQTIEITGVSDKSDVHDGTFTLTSPGGNTTGNLDHDATNAEIETALEGLADITDVVVTGGPIASGVVSVEFAGTNANTDVSIMSASPSLDSGQGDITRDLDLDLDQASRGEHHIDDPDNYDDGSLPAASDTIVVDGADLYYGLEFLRGQSGAIKIFSGRVGLPYRANGYVEYRPRRLKGKWATVEIGTAGGSGPRRAFVDYEDASSPAVTIHAAQGSLTSPAVDLVGNSGNTATIEVRDGSVALAPREDESLDFATLVVYGGTVQMGPTVTGDNGASNTVLEIYGGEVYYDSLQIKNAGKIRRLRE